MNLLEQREQHLKYNKIDYFKPYPWQREFMFAGKDYMQRALVAANRTGKTFTAAMEISYHTTGRYPENWEGHRFPGGIHVWAVGDTAQTTRDVNQETLLGTLDDLGSGTIPKDCIIDTSRKAGIPDAIETVIIQHVSGQKSYITFKSYDQKRKAFQGTYKHLIWLDEEPSDRNIYSECLTRLVNDVNPGIILCTFTPLMGKSPIVRDFLINGVKFPENNVNGYKYIRNVSWEDAPHITEQQKQILLASYSPHEREARSRGIPSLGAGAIYPYFEDQITYDPFDNDIPPWWPKAYGLDTGWKTTAAIWGAINPDEGVVYIYSEYYEHQKHPAINAHAIRARGEWMIGVADAQGVNGADGEKVRDVYISEGLKLEKANKKDVEAGILKVSQMFEAGKLKISKSCKQLLREIAGYTRREDGKINKDEDHACDALRYLIDTGLDFASCPNDYNEDPYAGLLSGSRDKYTGY